MPGKLVIMKGNDGFFPLRVLFKQYGTRTVNKAPEQLIHDFQQSVTSILV